MQEPHLAKLLDWFANMSVRLERMDSVLREVLEGQNELRDLMAHLQSDLRVVKAAVAHNSDSLQRQSASEEHAAPAPPG